MVGLTWFAWAAIDPEYRQAVGMYYDPDAVVNRVEAERVQRIEAKEAAKNAGKPAAPEEDEEEEEEEEVVTAQDIEDAVNAAVEQSEESDDAGDEEEEEEKGEEEEEEEEEEPKPKKEKVKAAPVVSELEALSEEINLELQEPELNEPPQSDDPAEWEAFLAAEGLIDDDFDMDDEF